MDKHKNGNKIKVFWELSRYIQDDMEPSVNDVLEDLTTR